MSTSERNPHYLFVLTDNFNCCLLAYNIVSNKIDVVSRGCLSEKGTGERRERPYPIIVDEKFIAIMLYDNVIKIIPLIHKPKPDSQFAISLSNALNLRVRHSEVNDVIQLSCSTTDMPCFALLYQRMEHGVI